MNEKEEKQTVEVVQQNVESTYDDYMTKVDLITCPGCKYESSTENVRLHLKRLHMDGRMCKICDKNILDKRSQHCAKHILIVIISQLREQCNECSKFFMLDSKSSDTEIFTCKECQLKHSTKIKDGEISTLNGTETPIDNTPKFPHRCDTCHKRFAHRKTLNEHMRTVHADNELYQCEYCPRVFHYRKNLNAHRRVHTNPAICEICFAEFNNQHNLNRHMLSHAEPPEYNCSNCGKMFRGLTALESHTCRSDEQEAAS